MKKITFFLCAVLLFTACSGDAAKFSTPYFTITLNEKGGIQKIVDETSGENYAPEDVLSPILRLHYGQNGNVDPLSMSYDSDNGMMILTYPNGVVANISCEIKGNYVKFSLVSLDGRGDDLEAVVWGPYSTTINDQIGETVCVVRDSVFSFGMQALNINTIEGIPENGDDAYGGSYIDPLPGQSVPDELKNRIGEKIPFVNVNVEGDMPDYVRLWRGAAAAKNATGSELRLFSRDWRKGRVIDIYERKQYVEPIDVDLLGSSVAIFGCPEPKTLDIIEEIELGENLPHPIIDGVWLKRWDKANQAYMLYEGTNDQNALNYADSCNFKLIHAGDMFKSWGHFDLTSQRFPGGAEEITAMTDRARDKGVDVGVHTLTMFTSQHDPYVSPIPSDSLCKAGSTVLSADISAKDTEIAIEDAMFFTKPGLTRTVKIGKELVGYSGVSQDEPLRLLNCVRGQFGTKISDHKKGSVIDKLVNDDYSGFFPDIKLQDAYSKRLAEVCKETGVGLMDFDGYGGGSPTGHGCYGAGRFVSEWYNNLDKYRITCGAGTFHYYWHIYTFMNWGEPWYDNLRESQVNYRLENQRYFKRNLMPGMLGWFVLEPSYRPEDIEWIQARSAGFDAGYLLRVNEVIESSGFKSQLFEAVREWQKARNSHSFTKEQQLRMQNPKNEFHLSITDGGWNLYDVNLQKDNVHKFRNLQTGEPLVSKYVFENDFEEQAVQFYAYILPGDDKNGKISNLVLMVNDFQPVAISGTLEAGDKIYCDGSNVYVCDTFWKKKSSQPISVKPVWLKGKNTTTISCDFSGDKAPIVSFEYKALSVPEFVKAK